VGVIAVTPPAGIGATAGRDDDAGGDDPDWVCGVSGEPVVLTVDEPGTTTVGLICSGALRVPVHHIVATTANTTMPSEAMTVALRARSTGRHRLGNGAADTVRSNSSRRAARRRRASASICR